MSRPAVFIDASIYIFRAYFSLPERWHSPEGYPLNAVYGYASFLVDLLSELDIRQPISIAAAFDESLGSCFRNRLYPAYKASRELPDEALAFQLRTCRELTELLGIPCYGCAEYEADDYIASLSRQARKQGQAVTVVSRDKDLGQVLRGDDDLLWDYAAGKRLSRAGFQERFGVLPEQFADYQGLVGDAIDDIPGVPAVGAKTAARLIAAFGDLESLWRGRSGIGDLGLRGAARITRNLESFWEQALISRDLARLCDTIPGLSGPGAYQASEPELAAWAARLGELQLGGPLGRRANALAATLRD